MAKLLKKRKCAHCGVFFRPDSKNYRKQRYCRNPECRKASKAASQKLWLDKPENRDYFRCPENTRRVQEWRRSHPGYRQRKLPKQSEPLQDLLTGKAISKQRVEPVSPERPLQDLLNFQSTVLIGLIAQLAGSALQEDIASFTRRLQQLGCDILNSPLPSKGDGHGSKASPLSRAPAPGPRPVQLGGSAPGP